jgi:hypothetical protein
VTTGNSLNRLAGTITLSAGNTAGGALRGATLGLNAGSNTIGTGGDVRMRSGLGSASSSGFITIESANAGTTGISGQLSFKTGTTSAGDSGDIILETGESTAGKAGTVQIVTGETAVGPGAGK